MTQPVGDSQQQQNAHHQEQHAPDQSDRALQAIRVGLVA
jgi:hypothetical protein